MLGERASHSIWHNRLGNHVVPIVSNILCKHSHPITSIKMLSLCTACQQDKSHHLHLTKSPLSSHPFDIIFFDVWGLSPVTSNDNYQYYVSFLDDFSKFVWGFHLRLKSEVDDTFLRFQRYIERLFN